MAIAELVDNALPLGDVIEGAGKVRLAVHDASRIEWSLSVPIPSSAPTPYVLRVELQIPSQTFVRQTPWDQMQAFTRLDGPAVTVPGDAVTIDNLRRGALAAAGRLARANDRFQRHCRLAASLFATTPHRELEESLTIWVDAAVRIAEQARGDGALPADDEPEEIARERALVDEYVSVRLLEMLAGAERALCSMMKSPSRNAERIEQAAAAVEARLAEALSDELDYRERRGFLNADPNDPAALERYLDRASRLKKHFQEVLFLELESFKVAERAYHWIAALVALFASTWAFAWQIALTTNASKATTVSSGLVTLALLAGLVYATKDRIKEIGRNWMTRRVHRVWGAQRVTRYRAPARRLPGRDVVAVARESFDEKGAKLPDPLNPEAGATVPVTVLRYEHRGEVLPSAELVASGVRRVKHVFRYDLSPMFCRLDDAVKPVPVLDDATRKVRFIDAPRCYRVPIKIEVECGGQKSTELRTLIIHKRGLERLDSDSDSDPSLAEIGIEPG